MKPSVTIGSWVAASLVFAMAIHLLMLVGLAPGGSLRSHAAAVTAEAHDAAPPVVPQPEGDRADNVLASSQAPMSSHLMLMTCLATLVAVATALTVGCRSASALLLSYGTAAAGQLGVSSSRSPPQRSGIGRSLASARVLLLI